MAVARPLLQPPEEFMFIVLITVDCPCIGGVKGMIVLMQQGA